MKFDDIERGVAATTASLLPGKKTKAGGPVTVLLRVLDTEDEANVIAGARDYAASKGSKDPKLGDPLFELGVMLHTLLLAAVDSDSTEEKREPFFGKLADILTLDRDTIALLYERHEAWQGENSPYARDMPPDELFARTLAIAAAEDDYPFVELAPFMRSRWARITAKLYVSSLADKLPPGLPSAPTSPSSLPRD